MVVPAFEEGVPALIDAESRLDQPGFPFLFPSLVLFGTPMMDIDGIVPFMFAQRCYDHRRVFAGHLERPLSLKAIRSEGLG
jgi:hypothetical protein